jgi:hypothetical protein
MNKKMGIGYWALITIGILLNLMMLVGQTGALIDYDFTVSIGMQESVEEVTGVGVAWAKGFGFGDTIIYIPLFIAGISGTLKRKKWGLLALFGALAITAYWPMVCLFTVFIGKDAINLSPDKYASYLILLPSISIYGLWGMWFLYKNWNNILNKQDITSIWHTDLRT